MLFYFIFYLLGRIGGVLFLFGLLLPPSHSPVNRLSFLSLYSTIHLSIISFIRSFIIYITFLCILTLFYFMQTRHLHSQHQMQMLAHSHTYMRQGMAEDVSLWYLILI